MNFQEYRPLALRTAAAPRHEVFDDLEHAALGFATEFGEFITLVKRNWIYGRALGDAERAHMREELGDALWYVPLALRGIGFPESDNFTAELEADADFKQASSEHNLLELSITAMIVVGEWPLIYSQTACLGCRAKALLKIYGAVQSLCWRLGFDIGEIMAENIAKLRLRFPYKFSFDAAEARADKGGLTSRES